MNVRQLPLSQPRKVRARFKMMKARKDIKYYLVLTDRKVSSSVRTVLAKMAEENPAAVIRALSLGGGKTGKVTAALREAVRKGAGAVYILPMGTLPKRALRDDIPLAVRQVREKNMAVDFHYAGTAVIAGKK